MKEELNTCLAYMPGRCSICNAPIPTAELAGRQVSLDIIGSHGSTVIECWIDRECQPDPASLRNFSRRLATQIITWYFTTVELDVGLRQLAVA
jgi:hypothetical protein